MQRFINLGIVGEGSYGMVFKCLHKKTGHVVAIKKFIELDADALARKIAVREIRMLKLLQHENVITLIEIFQEQKELYLVFEFMDRTLLDEMTRWMGIPNQNTCRQFLWQILKGLEFMHSRNVIHRDIKPENVLVSNRGLVKICDLGFARTLTMPGEMYTDYVATRWYRAPELVIGDIKYGRAVDIWAIGCLLPEMLSGKPLFPGDSDIDQLFMIMECFGSLTQRHKEVFRRNPLFIGMRLPQVYHIVPLEYKLSAITVSAQCLSFMKQCLQIDPARRPSCTDLLSHDLFLMDGFDKSFPLQLKQILQIRNKTLSDLKTQNFSEQKMQSTHNYDSNDSYHLSSDRSGKPGRLRRREESKVTLKDKYKRKGTVSSLNRFQTKYPPKGVSITSRSDQTLKASSADSGSIVISQGTSNNNSNNSTLSLTDYNCFDQDKNVEHCSSLTQCPVTSMALSVHIQAKNRPVKKVCKFFNMCPPVHHHHCKEPSMHKKLSDKSLFCNRSMEKVQDITFDMTCEEQMNINLPEVNKITNGCKSGNKMQTSCMRSCVTTIPYISQDEHFKSASVTQLNTSAISDQDFDISGLPKV